MTTSIVIPLHNEEDNINPLVREIRDKYPEYELVLVDDNSTDRTPRIINNLAIGHKNIHTMYRTNHPGMGHALIEGTLEATGKYVVWLMGDRSDNLDTIKSMIQKLDEGCRSPFPTDIVVGSRYMEGGDSGDLDAFKATCSSLYTKIARLRFNLPIHDITNAFRAFRRDVFLEALPLRGDFAISPEFIIKAHKRGYRVSEVPTTYKNRTHGKTKFKMIQMGWEYLKLLFLPYKR